jgi:hypothetical protein
LINAPFTLLCPKNGRHGHYDLARVFLHSESSQVSPFQAKSLEDNRLSELTVTDKWGLSADREAVIKYYRLFHVKRYPVLCFFISAFHPFATS